MVEGFRLVFANDRYMMHRIFTLSNDLILRVTCVKAQITLNYAGTNRLLFAHFTGIRAHEIAKWNPGLYRARAISAVHVSKHVPWNYPLINASKLVELVSVQLSRLPTLPAE